MNKISLLLFLFCCCNTLLAVDQTEAVGPRTQLLAPWRHEAESKAKVGNKSLFRDMPRQAQEQCSFCNELAEHNDENNFILRRFKTCYAKLNRLPYGGGHIMVLPLEHKAFLHEFSDETRNEIMAVTNQIILALEKIRKPDGFNVGFNCGFAGGATIPSHFHLHILPRHLGEVAFIETIGMTRVISIDVTKMYAELKPAFDEMKL